MDRAKDDWRDAFQIADLLPTGKFTETQLRAGAYAELQVGYATDWRLRLDRGRQLTRLTNSLRQLFPELSQVFKNLTGVTAQAVRAGPAAAQIRVLSWPDFLSRVRAVATGQRLALSRLRQVYALAPNSIGLTQGVEALCWDVQAVWPTSCSWTNKPTPCWITCARSSVACPQRLFCARLRAWTNCRPWGSWRKLARWINRGVVRI